MVVKNLQENFGMTGIVRVFRYRAGTLARVRESLQGSRILNAEAQAILSSGLIGIHSESKNTVVTSEGYGRNIILRGLVDDPTYDHRIRYGQIGTSSTAPTAADIALGAAVLAVNEPVYTVVDNVLTLQFFFPDTALTNGTYREFGVFMGSNATALAGRMLNHVLFSSPYTKASGEDTTVQIVFTLS